MGANKLTYIELLRVFFLLGCAKKEHIDHIQKTIC